MKNLFHVFDQLNVSANEQIIIDRFRQSRTGALQIAKILQSYGQFDESCELLAWALRRSPDNTALRVAYAQQLFARGLIMDCWKILSDGVPIRGVLWAKQLRFQCAILLGFEAEAVNIATNLESLDQHNSQTRSLSATLLGSGIYQASSYLLDDLRSRQIEPIVPRNKSFVRENVENIKVADVTRIVEHIANHADHFVVTPLVQVLDPIEVHDGCLEFSPDSEAAAKFYEDRGDVLEALAIYRQLSKDLPMNLYLRDQIDRLEKQADEQLIGDQLLNPYSAKKIESLDKIDQRIDHMQSLLTNLDRS